jgi:hypothetical protein
MSLEQSVSRYQQSMPLIAIEPMAVARLRPYTRNARIHSKKQVRQIADSIQKFGFTNPVLISDDGEIIAGHGRVEAAKLLGMQDVPTLRLSHLDAAQRRAYVLADNKLALNAGWDRDVLAIELQALVDLDFAVEITGFSLAEVDLVLDEARESSAHAQDTPEDEIPPLIDPAYCDQIVRRFEQVTGKQSKLAATGQSFEAVAAERGLSEVPSTSEETVS